MYTEESSIILREIGNRGICTELTVAIGLDDLNSGAAGLDGAPQLVPLVARLHLLWLLSETHPRVDLVVCAIVNFLCFPELRSYYCDSIAQYTVRIFGTELTYSRRSDRAGT